METGSKDEISCFVAKSHRCSRITWQFLLLVHKNFKLQFRRPIGTIVELFLPIVAVVFIIILEYFLDFRNELRCFTTFEPDQLTIAQTPAFLTTDPSSIAVHDIYYTPRTPDTDAVMKIVGREIGLPYARGFRVIPFATENEVLKNMERIDRNKTLYNACIYGGAGIIFNSLHGNELKYTIRLPHEVGRANSWKTVQTSPNFELPGPRRSNLYLFEGFVQLQRLIGDAIIEWSAKKANLPYQSIKVSVRQLPYPEYSINEFLSSVNIILPLLFVLAFLYTAGIVVKELVLEKETRIRESMLMMGLKQWVLWATWFTKQFIFLIPPIFVTTFLVKFLLFPKSDWILLFVFFILYVISLICFSFLISVWFSSARVGLIIGFITWFANFFPFLFLVMRYRSISFGIIVLSCLLSNTALGFGVEIIARLEQRTEGLLWSNVADPITLDTSFNMAWVFSMLVIDSIFYMTVAWYVNEVKPGQYGVPKPFYFPFLPSYWCNTKRLLSKALKVRLTQSADKYDPSAHEKVRGNLEVGISIKNLTKVYSGLFGRKGVRKKAVDNLNLDIYKGQITALLGHNGAGKTTTMSILTGLFTPTGGTAIINGYNILTDMDLIRDSLGICPQHNVLFGRLTVREHLSFFIRLKGIHDKRIIKDEVDQMLNDLLLSDKGDVQACHLSGGMKRKLSVGIALIGGSEVVILDEPTAGMDPYARRATWDLLAKYKQNRCILMSTHLMDEADLLGDRIAIMAEGKLRCSGSSLFLKSRYGVGYHMTLVKELKCFSSEIESLVKSYVPSAEKMTDVGMELSFILPSSGASKFPELFDRLESMKTNLGISSFGISITTMEEVFIKVGEGTDETLKSAIKKKHSSIAAMKRRRARKRRRRSILAEDSKKHNYEMPTKHDSFLDLEDEVKVQSLDKSAKVGSKSNSKDDFIQGSPQVSVQSPTASESTLIKGPNASVVLEQQLLSESLVVNEQSKSIPDCQDQIIKSECSVDTTGDQIQSQIQCKEKEMDKLQDKSDIMLTEDISVQHIQDNPQSKLLEPSDKAENSVHHIAEYSKPLDVRQEVSTTKEELTLGSIAGEQTKSHLINTVAITLPPVETTIVLKLDTKTEKNQVVGIAGHPDIVRGRNLITLPPIQIPLISTLKIESLSPKSRMKQKRKPLPPIQSLQSSEEDGLSCETDLSSIESKSRDWVKLSYHYEPNKGFILWLQQFRAMFIKRLYYSIRFYPALLTQILFPVLSVAIGLLVILSNPKDDDPPRALYMSNTGLDSRNTTIFYAELDENTMKFSDFSAKDFLVTDYLDITAGVNLLRESVKEINDVDECCNYKYQFLDKFCASRNSFELQHCKDKNPSFGYSRCMPCLTCCDSINRIDSCTFPTSVYVSPPTNGSRCPSPPSLSLYSTTTGPLDTTNTFVAEYLLRSASKLGAVPFFRTYQAGFTVAAQDPIISACGCTRIGGKSEKGCNLYQRLGLTPCNSLETCPYYHYVSPFMCPIKQFNETLCRKTPICYSVEAYSSDFLQNIICSPDGNRMCGLTDPDLLQYSYPPRFSDKRSLSKVHPEVLSTPAVTVWYNNGAYHMIAAAFNSYQSLRLKQITKNKTLSMVVVNHPLPRNPEAVAQDTTEDFTGFGLAILVVFGYSFFLGNFIVFLVREKESKAKHLQFVSGVSATSYWLSALTWDLINAFLPIFLTLVVFRGFRLSAFHGSALTSILLVLIFTCWAGIPLTYIFSFFFKNALVAFSVLIIVFFFFTVLLLTTIFLVQLYGKENKEEIADRLHHFFLMTPTYGMASTLSDIYINSKIREFCPHHLIICDALNLTYVDTHLTFNRPGVGVTCVYLIIQGIVFIIITILLELKCFIPSLKRYFKTYKAELNLEVPIEEGEDEDVYVERKRVLNGDTANDIVIIKKLVKIYRPHILGCTIRPAKTAVAGISLGIPNGECFGLLGVNGAGKTTTFSILTGDITMTSGTAIIGGNDIRTSLKAVRQGLGYCPQFDALIERMTARELLWMYARLRGVPEDQISEVVDSEIRRLDLLQYANKRCGTYSGGVKRKLSTAIAMVGNPPLILLDEPTTGMDPNTRRYLWDVLTKVVQEGRSIILTSHSMEECEALCTRLAIMVNGQFKCLGSIQHLKNKYGSGITLQVKVKHLPAESTLCDQSELNKRSRGLFSSFQTANEQIKRSGFFSWQHRRSEYSTSTAGVLPNSKKASRNTVDTPNQRETANLHTFISDNFIGAVVVEEHVGTVTYWLPNEDVSWSSVFRFLEENKEYLGIVDYSVSQTTLEQVFINFAKEQEEELMS